MEQPPDPDFVEDMADVEARTLEQQKEYGKSFSEPYLSAYNVSQYLRTFCDKRESLFRCTLFMLRSCCNGDTYNEIRACSPENF